MLKGLHLRLASKSWSLCSDRLLWNLFLAVLIESEKYACQSYVRDHCVSGHYQAGKSIHQM